MNLKRFDKKEKLQDQMREKEQQMPANGIVEKICLDGILTICLSGKVDVQNYEEIQSEVSGLVNSESFKKFVFDMDKVTYVSSAGLRMFSSVNQKVSEKDAKYELINMREDIMKLFQMTGYASAFVIKLKSEE